MKQGWYNVHIDLGINKLYISQKPYSTKEEAEKGIFIGPCICKIGTFFFDLNVIIKL